MVTHNFLGPVITAASLHVDTSIPNFITQEYSCNDEGEHIAVYKTVHKREGGYIPVSEVPGLGVELDEELISKTEFSPKVTGRTPLREDGSVAYSV